MHHYILSKKAQEDIDSIYKFGVLHFGEDKALNYLVELSAHFEVILKNLETGKQRDEIKDGLYSLPYASHIIFYRILKNHLRIVRVLHGSRDLRKFLK